MLKLIHFIPLGIIVASTTYVNEVQSKPKLIIKPIAVGSFKAQIYDTRQQPARLISSRNYDDSYYEGHVRKNFDNLNITFDYFSDKHGLKGFDGNTGDTVIKSYLFAWPTDLRDIYGPGDGSTCTNGGAAWYIPDGSLIFGNACDQYEVHWEDDLDIVVHEFSHGIIHNTSKLRSGGESGALAESFGDIMMAMVDYQQSGSESEYTWMFGENITSTTTNLNVLTTRLREMGNPARNFRGIDLDPGGIDVGTKAVFDEQKGVDHYSNLGIIIHRNAAISNLAFYLFTHGGSHPRLSTLPSGALKPVVSNVCMNSGNCFDIAADIFYRAYTDNLMSVQEAGTVTFSDAKEATAQVAAGYGSAIQKAICDAWDAVGVPNVADSSCSDDVIIEPPGLSAPQTLDVRSAFCYGLNDVTIGSVANANVYELWQSFDSKFTSTWKIYEGSDRFTTIDVNRLSYIKAKACDSKSCSALSNVSSTATYSNRCF